MCISSNPDTKTPLRAEDLNQFSGSENFYRHPLFRKFVYTEGVRYVAQKAGAYWLIEQIFALQGSLPVFSGEPFTVWTLKREGDRATLHAEDGNGGKLYSETITYTDFPLTEITLWLVDQTLLLPSEY